MVSSIVGYSRACVYIYTVVVLRTFWILNVYRSSEVCSQEHVPRAMILYTFCTWILNFYLPRRNVGIFAFFWCRKTLPTVRVFYGLFVSFVRSLRTLRFISLFSFFCDMPTSTRNSLLIVTFSFSFAINSQYYLQIGNIVYWNLNNFRSKFICIAFLYWCWIIWNFILWIIRGTVFFYKSTYLFLVKSASLSIT